MGCFSIGTVGIATPAGIGIAAAGGVGAMSVLTGVGFFGYGNTRTGLSKDIMSLSDAIQQPSPG